MLLQRAANPSEWTPANTIAVVAIIASVVGVVFNNLLSTRSRRHERIEDRRQERQREALSIVGPLHSLILDMLPMRLVFFDLTAETAPERFGELTGRWQLLRPTLYALQLTHFDDDVKRLSAGVANDVELSLNRTALYARTMLRHEAGEQEAMREADAAHKVVNASYAEWVDAVQSAI